MNGSIFNVQRFSLHDGPGIRTVVFMKGCPLRCRWCHNPESVSAEPCEMTETNGKSKIYGRSATVDEVLDEVGRDAQFYAESGGGMTLSGGEPMFQPEFATALAEGAKRRKITTYIETCGFCARACFEKILPYTDGFLFDWKLSDPTLHKEYTGADNSVILNNLTFLGECGADITLRCPIIPGVNDTESHAVGIIRAAHAGNVRQINLMPYHKLGESKAEKLGLTPFRAEPPTEQYLQALTERLSAALEIPITVSR